MAGLRKSWWLMALVACSVLVACSPADSLGTPALSDDSDQDGLLAPAPTPTPSPTPTPTPTPSPVSFPTLTPSLLPTPTPTPSPVPTPTPTPTPAPTPTPTPSPTPTPTVTPSPTPAPTPTPTPLPTPTPTPTPVPTPMPTPTPVPSENTITTLDPNGSGGWESSVAIGADGLPLVAYNDEVNDELKVAHCLDVACTNATITTLDTSGDVGQDVSVTVGVDGLGLISYYHHVRGSQGALRVAHCLDVGCTDATIAVLDTSANAGIYTSVTIGADGLGLISYGSPGPERHLKVAHCLNVACTSATISTVDATGFLSGDTSIAIGADGLGLISYESTLPPRGLRVAHCSNLSCSSATISANESPERVNGHSTLTIGADGLGLISFRGAGGQVPGELRIAHCVDVTCTTAATAALDTDLNVGAGAFIAIGTDGLGLISYSDPVNHDLKVAHCLDVGCTSTTNLRLNLQAERPLEYISMTIGGDGLPLIVYRDLTGTDFASFRDELKVVHCGNIFCAS